MYVFQMDYYIVELRRNTLLSGRITIFRPDEILYRRNELIYRLYELIYRPDALVYCWDELLFYMAPDEVLCSFMNGYHIDELFNFTRFRLWIWIIFGSDCKCLIINNAMSPQLYSRMDDDEGCEVSYQRYL